MKYLLSCHPERKIAASAAIAHGVCCQHLSVPSESKLRVFWSTCHSRRESGRSVLCGFIRGICPFTQHCRGRASEKRTAQNCCRKVPAHETSIITRLFEGQLSYSITCLKCETCTYKNEVFTILSLPIPSEYECSLQVGRAQLLNTCSCFVFL